MIDEPASKPPERPDIGGALAMLRDAAASDLATIARFIRELAVTEGFPGTVTSTEDDIAEVLFGPRAFARCRLVEVDSSVVGFALCYPTFSTVTGRRGVHLEDLYIDGAHRGRGLGELLVRDLAVDTKADGGRLEWWVLRTNEPGQRFYRRIGAREVGEVSVWRLDGEALDALVDPVVDRPSRTPGDRSASIRAR